MAVMVTNAGLTQPSVMPKRKRTVAKPANFVGAARQRHIAPQIILYVLSGRLSAENFTRNFFFFFSSYVPVFVGQNAGFDFARKEHRIMQKRGKNQQITMKAPYTVEPTNLVTGNLLIK